MNHQEARELFTSYHDGELNENERTAVEAHLSECSECNTEWLAYKKLMTEVSGLMNLSPPKDVVGAVERKIHRRSKGKFFGRSRASNIQFALVSFILVLLFMLAYLMLTAVNEIVVLDSDATAPDPAAESSDVLQKQ
ncbi:MAG: zf-HC2 domain-containing protein [Deltaproteobacteria bacterium]|nr:zf-HC2 domain-containing protein [Deltaproteobacteria bacterium]